MKFKQRNIALIAAAIFALAITAVVVFLRSPGTAGPTTAATAQAKKEVWVCPMHPQVRQDHPGKCPICGMSLVKEQPAPERPAQPAAPAGSSDEHAAHVHGAPAPAPTDASKTHAPFQLSLDRQQMIGVKVSTVEKGPVFRSIRAAGRIAFDPELYTAQTEYFEALRQYQEVKNSPVPDVRHSAERMIHSSKLRLKLLGLSDKQIADLGSTSTDSQGLLLPQKGDSIYVYAEVYESDLPNVHAGLSAEISAGFLGGETLAGKIMSVDRVINPTTRTAKVRILIPASKTQLRPESYVDVTILSPLGEQLTVPFDAVLDTGKQAWVFVKKGEGTFEPRLITVQTYADDRVVIGKGVSAGEQIVTSANFMIDSESRLRAVGPEQ